MTNQRLISDARRRARALSVETGRPYQSHLDDVAHLAGRADWRAFIADPAPLPALAREASPEVPDTASATPPPSTGMSQRRLPRRRAAMHGALATTIAMIVLIMTIIATRPLFTRDLGTAITLDKQRRTIATLVLPTLTHFDRNAVNAAVWVMPDGRRDVLLTVIDNRPIAPTGLLAGLKRWATGFPNPHGPKPMEMVASWMRTGHTMGSTGESSMGIYHSYFEHPVVRNRFTIDCKSGIWHMTDLQTADDFVSPAAYSLRRNGISESRRVHPPLTTPERDALCSEDALVRTRRLQGV